MRVFNFLEQTLQSSSKIATDYFGQVTGSVKTDDNNQVLTQADLKIGEHIVSQITQDFPDFNIIDEEAGVIDNNSDFTWVVDPIDGTSNFAVGLPTYGIMIGLLQHDTPIAGGIALPAFNELYVGGKNFPTQLNGQPLTYETETELKNTLVAYGIDGHQEAPELTTQETSILNDIILGIRNLRTTNSAYDMAKTVQGKYGLYLNQTTKIWDNVAVQAVIEAAGGICTDFWGQPLRYDQPLSRTNTNYTICMGSKQLHAQIQAIIGTYAAK